MTRGLTRVRIPLNRSQKLVDTVSVPFLNLELTHPVCIIDVKNDVNCAEGFL